MIDSLPALGNFLPAAYENLKALLWTDSPLDMGIRITGGYLVAVWIASVIWTVRDITDRTGNLLVQTFCVLLVVAFTPVLGLPLYLLIRPRTTLAERYYEEAGINTDDEAIACPDCTTLVGEDFRFCPACGKALLEECPDCGAPKAKDWKFCAACWSDGLFSKTEAVLPKTKPEKKPETNASGESPSKEDSSEQGEENVSLPMPNPEPEESTTEPEPQITVIRVDDIPEAGKH